MKYYIAGRINGDEKYREKFKEYADRLQAKGAVVLNPAELPEGMSPADYMSICIPMIYAADTVMFLPDWVNSSGAMLEFELCKYIGKKIIVLSPSEEGRCEQ